MASANQVEDRIDGKKCLLGINSSKKTRPRRVLKVTAKDGAKPGISRDLWVSWLIVPELVTLGAED